MARAKEANFVSESKVARYITDLCNRSDKTQAEIAAEIGFEKSNVITMLKQGRIKVPIPRIPAIAKALNSDPAVLLDMVLQESHPEIRDVLLLTKGVVVDQEEAELITLFREAKAEKAKHGSDCQCVFNASCKERLKKAFTHCLKEAKQ